MKKLFFIIILLSANISLAQTLDQQFEELKESSETFKQFKLVDIQKLNNFWATTNDSIQSLRGDIESLKADNELKKKNIAVLEQELKIKNERIEELETQTSTIEVFGANINKGTFIFITFFTIGALVLVLIFIIYQFKDNRRLARMKVKDYEALNERFEEYKKDALEKQMKLRRELQTERNKLEEARGKK